MSVPGPGPLWVAALPGMCALAIWAVKDVQRFVLLLVLPAMVVPTALARPGGTEIALADLLLLAALGAWVVALAVGAARQPELTGNRMLVPCAVFVGFNLVSLLWSNDLGATAVFVIQLTEIVLVFPILFASLPTEMRSIRVGLLVFVACTCVVAAIAAVAYAPRAASGSLEGQSFSAGLNKNVIGSFVAAGLVIAYTMWVAEPRGTVRRWLAVGILVEAAGLVASVSRGSILGALFAVVLACFLLRRRRVATLCAVAIFAVGYLTVIGAGSNTDRSLSGSYDSSTVRTLSFENAIEKIQARPVLGTGGGTYTDYIDELEFFLPDPNNMFLLTWAELGIGGVLVLIFLLVSFARLLFRVRGLPDAHAVPAVAAGCVSVSLFVHFQTDVTWTRGTSSLAFAMIGVMLAAERLAVTAQPTPAAVPESDPHPRAPTVRPLAGLHA